MAKQNKPQIGKFSYYDSSSGRKCTGKCDADHSYIFDGKYVYLDSSNPDSTPLIRIGASGPSAKAIIMDLAGEKPWSDKSKPRLFSRHIACKNGKADDLRVSNLIIGKDAIR